MSIVPTTSIYLEMQNIFTWERLKQILIEHLFHGELIVLKMYHKSMSFCRIVEMLVSVWTTYYISKFLFVLESKHTLHLIPGVFGSFVRFVYIL